jgi:hypothetical protein
LHATSQAARCSQATKLLKTAPHEPGQAIYNRPNAPLVFYEWTARIKLVTVYYFVILRMGQQPNTCLLGRINFRPPARRLGRFRKKSIPQPSSIGAI